MTGADIAMLVVLGGLLGLDTVSFPQAMFSRPIVAATIAGALLGDPMRGLLLGATLELFAVDTLPFGASRYPEWGSSSVVGSGLFVTSQDLAAGALVAAVLGTLIMAWIGGLSMIYVRKFNAWLARRQHSAVASGDRRAIAGLQFSGLTADLLRGALLTAAGFLALAPVTHAVLVAWSGSGGLSRAMVVATAGAVALGATYKLFHGVPGFLWKFGIGLGGGLLLVALR
jgi:mannose/fructose/N-acetylgalactosamine-specific phosphotransferase system component IIC